MMKEMSFAKAAAIVSGGGLVWAAHFTVVYGYTGIACARRFDAVGRTLVALVPWVIAIASVAAAAAALMIMVRMLRVEAGPDFTRRVGAGVAALALVAIVLEAIPVVWVPVCG